VGVYFEARRFAFHRVLSFVRPSLRIESSQSNFGAIKALWAWSRKNSCEQQGNEEEIDLSGVQVGDILQKLGEKNSAGWTSQGGQKPSRWIHDTGEPIPVEKIKRWFSYRRHNQRHGFVLMKAEKVGFRDFAGANCKDGFWATAPANGKRRE